MAIGTSEDMVHELRKDEKNLPSQHELRLVNEIGKYLLKGKPGRPTKYKKQYAVDLVKHMAQGFNFSTYAAMHGTSVSTLQGWCDRHAEFAAAKKIGEALCERWWLNVGRGAVLGKIKNFNSAVWIFTMKNMFKWRDKHEIELENREIREIIHKVEIGLDGDITQEVLELE